tara:strand:+ start:2209 stop:3414 length:1206 start_codon:yes stop_codon:yes gene_type:complete
MSELKEDLQEIQLLSETLGIDIVDTSIHNLKSIHPSTFISKTKAEEIVSKAKMLKCNNIILNDDISPAQMKNLQNIAGFDVRILDRTGIIIDIFNIHAKSNESKKQVELAKLEYMLPRLTRQWTHLERQMGGTGTRGGPGEKQIEIDRRLIRKEIDKLKKDLSKIKQSREIQRKKRSEAICVSLAGYTNAGKSSLMNRLTGANVYIENELFATLDSTTKILDLDISQKILLSDTVGFIQKLPHELVASFQTTLSDIKRADLILKVIDSSYSNLSMHIDTIEKTLKELNSSMINSVFVFNKIDLIDNKQIKVLLKRYPESIFISCQDNSGIDYLIEYIKNSIREKYIQKTLKIKYSQLNYINDIYENLDVLKREDKESYILIKVEGNKEKIKWVQSKLKVQT